MTTNQWLTLVFCVGIPVTGMVGFGIVATFLRIKISAKIYKMQKEGTYKQWKEKNKALFLFERAILIVFGTSFLSIFILALLPRYKAEIIAPLAFIPLVLSAACGPIHLYLLYHAANMTQ